MASVTTPKTPLGPVLVVGGCGFIGYHLVRRLLHDGENVYVIDCNVRQNLHDDAEYLRGDVNDAQALRKHLSKIQPRVIFHTASPLASIPASRQHEFEDTNVRGTGVLLDEATRNDSVQALVYTSTVDVYANPPHDGADETHPLWPPSDVSNQYNRTKAIADNLVRAANGSRLRTVSLRLSHSYGERHTQGLVEVLDACSGNRKLIQIGKGENLMEVVSAANATTALILAAKALLNPDSATGKVDGEAFNISDGAPVPFWHHIRVIWGVARGPEALESVTVIPSWVMLVVVYFLEWVLWMFTLDLIKPPMALRRTSLEYCTHTHTYNTEKAKERLQFQPVVDHDAVLAQSARWLLAHRRHG